MLRPMAVPLDAVRAEDGFDIGWLRTETRSINYEVSNAKNAAAVRPLTKYPPAKHPTARRAIPHEVSNGRKVINRPEGPSNKENQNWQQKT